MDFKQAQILNVSLFVKKLSHMCLTNRAGNNYILTIQYNTC